MPEPTASSTDWRSISEQPAESSSSDSIGFSSSSSPSPFSSYDSGPPTDDENLLDDLIFTPATCCPKPFDKYGGTYLTLQLRVATETDAIIAHFLQTLYNLCVPVSSTDADLVQLARLLREAKRPETSMGKSTLAGALEDAIVGRKMLAGYDRLMMTEKDMGRDLGDKVVCGYRLNQIERVLLVFQIWWG